jgi:hypothetical protein
MLKALLAGAAVTVMVAASPAFAQTTMKQPSGPMPMPMGPAVAPTSPGGTEIVPSEPVTPAERAQVRRDWDAMAREWEQRQRSGAVPPQGSIGAPSAGGSAYGGWDAGARIAPSMPMRGTGLQGAQEPTSPAERAQVRRDWNEMAREWEQRQRGGYAPPAGTGQPPLPFER